ncbi:hypothetical protein NY99_10870 [Xanthomonas phaseoli pv. phaseoli]|uniref:hypothetical protein n=1 Tax=Xanthomonas phaseoli TaxID=1985254 RepID=UPI000536EA9A|nr:hypothetical protein [Xanthomonas phaseoli]KGU55636.1 hypothetical protein NY99_10870 [Xanthomonas phaseoli pv. phaseoli]KHF49074.1 hypothetical protein QQ30_07420 [Xanthomonas phaseoli pv. phaseoli]KHS07242.1 hypothetical protein RM61_11900 [Xanthomonas phaseoli pv. phaseoli]KHS27242.1 hypothetical protein RM60_14535 [Xanthomonas phaseoli pv. phaseoli]
MRTFRIRGRRLGLRFRETVLLAGTLACSVLFVATQRQIGLLCYAVAPILLLAFFVLQADLVWRGHKTAGAAFIMAVAAWLTFSVLATYAFSGLVHTHNFLGTWLKALLGAGFFAVLFSLSVLLARKRSLSLYWYLAGSLAVVIAVAAVHPENSGDITVNCERGSCAAGIIAFWPGAFQAADGKRPISVVLPHSGGD